MGDFQRNSWSSILSSSTLAKREMIFESEGLLILNAYYLSLLKLDDNSAGMNRTEVKSVARLNEARWTSSVSSITLSDAPKVIVNHSEAVFKDILIFDEDLGIKFWKDGRLTIHIAHRRIIVE
jgi:hypothetical protein